MIKKQNLPSKICIVCERPFMWRKKWQWENSRDSILEHAKGATPPWESIRLIGHRGSGKTSRPVFK